MTLKEKLNASNSKLNQTVKVAGTDYDRRRKLTNKEIASMKRSYKSPNIDYKYLAEKFHVTQSTVRYHVDPEFKKRVNTERAKYKNKCVATPSYKEQLAKYKRDLLRDGKRLSTSKS